ncbi:YdeI/OmpD-associated family protein [Halomonas caseinilytica]|uniref:YdeI/OmpD-associated family protein n=1 Tax=Halomonas caseinilytica TaxID=438744 RepID=UPI003138A7B7
MRCPLMIRKTISAGVVHDVPEDLRHVLAGDSSVLALWEAITPIARNEWICWVEDAKKPETRHRRISRVSADLKAGKRRPCCWPGCPHRNKGK